MERSIFFLIAALLIICECAPNSISREPSSNAMRSNTGQNHQANNEDKDPKNFHEKTQRSSTQPLYSPTEAKEDTYSEIGTRSFRRGGRSRSNLPWFSNKFDMFPPSYFLRNLESMYGNAFFGSGYPGQYPNMPYNGMNDRYGIGQYNGNYGLPYNYPQETQGRYPALNQQRPPQTFYNDRPTELNDPAETSYYQGQSSGLNRLPQQQASQSAPSQRRNRPMESSMQQQPFGMSPNEDQRSQSNVPSRQFNPSRMSSPQNQFGELDPRTQTESRMQQLGITPNQDQRSQSNVPSRQFNPSRMSSPQNQFGEMDPQTQTESSMQQLGISPNQDQRSQSNVPSRQINPSRISSAQNQFGDVDARVQTESSMQQLGTPPNQDQRSPSNGPSRQFNPSRMSSPQNQFGELDARAQTESSMQQLGTPPNQDQRSLSNDSSRQFNPSRMSSPQNQLGKPNSRAQTLLAPGLQNHRDQHTNQENQQELVNSATSNDYDTPLRELEPQQQSTGILDSVLPFFRRQYSTSNTQSESTVSDPVGRDI